MRTTLTLDDDVVAMLETAVHREKKSMKQVVNEALRKGLASEPARARKRFRIRPHRTSLRGGLDPVALNRLLDEIEDEAVVEKFGRSR